MDELERWSNETFARRVGAYTLSLQPLDRSQSLIDTCPTRTLGQHSRALPSLKIVKPDETTTTAPHYIKATCHRISIAHFLRTRVTTTDYLDTVS